MLHSNKITYVDYIYVYNKNNIREKVAFLSMYILYYTSVQFHKMLHDMSRLYTRA